MSDLKLFYCYEHRDKQWFTRLDAHLSSLKREFQISTFSKYEALAGMEIEIEIDTQLNAADIILLLISSAFIASDYCCLEMEKALQRQKKGDACVIPILLRPVDRKDTFSKLQSLPANGKPITSWHSPEEALEAIAVGIRKRLEKERERLAQKYLLPEKKPASNTGTAMPETEQTLEDVPDQMKHYLYVSDTKVRNREEWWIAQWTKEAVSFQNRFHSLNAILTHLQKKRRIWSIDSGRSFRDYDYISGECPVHWGYITWKIKVCFFLASTPAGILVMAGSGRHLTSNQQPAEHLLKTELTGASGSDLPEILSAIEFAAEHNGVKWSNGINDNPSNYLFALSLAQGKFFHQMKIKRLSTAFAEQMVEFTALVLKTLQPPTEQQLADFFVNNAINPREQKIGGPPLGGRGRRSVRKDGRAGGRSPSRAAVRARRCPQPSAGRRVRHGHPLRPGERAVGCAAGAGACPPPVPPCHPHHHQHPQPVVGLAPAGRARDGPGPAAAGAELADGARHPQPARPGRARAAAGLERGALAAPYAAGFGRVQPGARQGLAHPAPGPE